MVAEMFVVSRRFCGRPQWAHGGYVCGRLAKHLPGPTAVRLRAPPPFEVELRIEISEDRTQLLQGSTLIAEARRAELDLTPPPAPSFAEAEKASKSYVGFTHHSFPECFVCGTQRADGDGMRIFPGLIEARSIVAAPWVPDASLAEGSSSVRTEFLWATLDCVGAIALETLVWRPLFPGKYWLTGELSARIDGSITPGEKCVVIGWPLQIDGRKCFAGSAVFSESGHPVAVGRSIWFQEK